MKNRFEGVTAFIKDKAEKATQSVNAFVESDDAKAAVAWTKNAVSIATDEAVELGKRAAHSELAKDAATGAGIGAVAAIPIPIIGPAIGAVLGAGAGMFLNFKKNASQKSDSSSKDAANIAPNMDLHKRLTELDDLRQKGLLTQEEFEVQKKKVLRNFSR